MDIKTELRVWNNFCKFAINPIKKKFSSDFYLSAQKFCAHDQSYLNLKELYAEVDRIPKELIARGHKYDASWIVRPIEHDETIETVLCDHSERLAIAADFLFNIQFS